MRRAVPLIFALLLAACPDPQTPAGPAPSGSASASPGGVGWAPRSFAKATEGCKQTWACDTSVCAPRAGCRAQAVADDTTTGVCAADSGPPTGCTRCMALPPPGECACKYACP